LKVILLNCQNNYVERLNIFDNAAKCFNILAISSNVLQWVLKLLERLENFVWAYIQCDIY